MTATPVAKPARADVAALWRRVLSKPFPMTVLYGFEPMQRIAMVKAGVPAEFLLVIVRAMDMPKEKLYKTIGVPRATIDRKLSAKTILNPDESERVVGIARLVGQVDTMVKESGNPQDFDAAKWVAAWLDRPLAALGGKLPGTLIDTAEGRGVVSDLLARMQTGAYA